MRIKLTDEDIFPIAQGMPTHWNLNITIPENTREQAEQLKKQILEDYKFREAIKILLDTEDLNVVFDIKDKADKFEGLKK